MGKWEQGSGKKDYMGKWEQGSGKKDYMGSGNREVGRMITWEVVTGQWEKVGTIWASMPPIK